MTAFPDLVKQSATFALKLFFAPVYGTYLAVREAMQERTLNVLREELLMDVSEAGPRTSVSNVFFLTPTEHRAVGSKNESIAALKAGRKRNEVRLVAEVA